MWGFWEGQHWLSGVALYRSDWSINPSGAAFRNLVFGRWWTNAWGVSDAGGLYKARGFLCEYRLSVTVNGKATTQAVRLAKGMNEVIVNR